MQYPTFFHINRALEAVNTKNVICPDRVMNVVNLKGTVLIALCKSFMANHNNHNNHNSNNYNNYKNYPRI